MNAKRTPGPWRAAGHTTNGKYRVQSIRGETVANCSEAGNAVFIALSPLLLDGLELAALAIEQLQQGQEIDPMILPSLKILAGSARAMS